MHAPLVPEATRRPDVPAAVVDLGDGRPWGFALPSLHPLPMIVREPDGFGGARTRFDQAARFGYPLAIRRLLNEVALTCRTGTDAEQTAAFQRLAVGLLRLAHELDEAEAEALLDPARVDLGRLARSILPAVLGPGRSPSPTER